MASHFKEAGGWNTENGTNQSAVVSVQGRTDVTTTFPRLPCHIYHKHRLPSDERNHFTVLLHLHAKRLVLRNYLHIDVGYRNQAKAPFPLVKKTLKHQLTPGFILQWEWILSAFTPSQMTAEGTGFISSDGNYGAQVNDLTKTVRWASVSVFEITNFFVGL